ncbi:MAG: hypothetical protein KC731_21365, partial [Myxococcales bacterium]|nr:hypothetical protein [Myxococcales bacterium]
MSQRKPEARTIRRVGACAAILGALAGVGALGSSCVTKQVGGGEGGGADLPVVGPGEVCFVPDAERVKVRFEPAFLVLAPGQTKKVRVVVDPDLCGETPITITGSNPEVAATPTAGTLNYGRPEAELTFTALTTGTTTIDVSVPTANADIVATASLEVEVMEAT